MIIISTVFNGILLIKNVNSQLSTKYVQIIHITVNTSTPITRTSYVHTYTYIHTVLLIYIMYGDATFRCDWKMLLYTILFP